MLKKGSIILFLPILGLSFQTHGQAKWDTLYYDLKPEMIAQATVKESEVTDEYFVTVRLKEEYHAEFAELTGDNIGNLLGMVYDEELISPTLPAIQARIRGGGFCLGDYTQKEKAIKVKNQILNQKESDSF